MANLGKNNTLILLAIGLVVVFFVVVNNQGRSDCLSEWSCSNWGSCIDGMQTRNCGDLNECPVPNPPPVLEQSCQLCQPSLEICDGVDNDCDGYVDEDLINYDTCYGKGLCAGSYRSCTDGAWSECTVLPIEETCNGIDDDCDGMTDESLQRSCVINTNPGVQTCAGGAWRTCEATTVSTFSCTNYQCVPDVNGQFGSESACDTACICESHWSCGGWTAWSNAAESCGSRTRTCVDDNSCPGAEFTGETTEYKECPSAVCGNSILEQGEFCDGILLNGKSCSTLGYDIGTLACNSDCTAYDTSNCEYDSGNSGYIPPLKYYSCSEDYECVENTDGKYLTNECGGKCIEPQKEGEIEPEPTALFSDKQLLFVAFFFILLVVVYNAQKGKK